MSVGKPPYPPPLPFDAGEKDIRETLHTLTSNLRQLSDELTTEREARARDAKDREKGVSVLNLHVPVALLAVIVSTLVGIGAGAGIFWRDAREHIADKQIHGDHDKALSMGGLAYNKEVDNKIADKVSDLEAADRRLARSIKTGAKCVNDAKHKGESSCVFIDPNSLPLH